MLLLLIFICISSEPPGLRAAGESGVDLVGAAGTCVLVQGLAVIPAPWSGEGWPSELGKPSPLPPMKHWVVSHFPLEQFHSPVKPAAKARWDGDPGPGKEVGERNKYTLHGALALPTTNEK